MCRFRLWLLYWVSTQIRKMPPLARLDSAKSTSRYRPPNGTADFARSSVRGASRWPAAPARTRPRTRWLAIGGSSSAEAFHEVLVQFPEPGRQVPVETAEELGDVLRLQLPGLGVHREQQVQVGPADVQAVQVQRARRGQVADRGPGRGRGTGQPLDDPFQHPDVLAEARPDELALRVLAEPVDVEQPRQLGRVGLLAEREPVREVVTHVVAAERQHGERVVAQLADPALGRGGL